MASKRAESAPPAEIRSFNRGMHYDYSSMPVKKRRTTTQAPRINIQSNSQEASIQWTLEIASMSEADESVCYPRDWIVYGFYMYVGELYIYKICIQNGRILSAVVWFDNLMQCCNKACSIA